MTINQSLKIKIIADYLSGMKREDIAKKYGISTGSVSAIAEEFEEEIPDIHKIRAMMIKLNSTGNSPKTFYHAIRLHEYIKNLGLTEVQAEKILEILQEYSFKENYNISDLFDAIINAHVQAHRYGTDLEHLDECVNGKTMLAEAKEDLVRKLNNDIEFLPHRLNIDLAEYQEYQKNKPILQKLMNMAVELDIQNRRNKLLEDDNKKLKSEKQILEIENERLYRLLAQQQQSKKADEYYTGYQQDISNVDSTDCLVDDNNDVEDNTDIFDRPQSYE